MVSHGMPNSPNFLKMPYEGGPVSFSASLILLMQPRSQLVPSSFIFHRNSNHRITSLYFLRNKTKPECVMKGTSKVKCGLGFGRKRKDEPLPEFKGCRSSGLSSPWRSLDCEGGSERRACVFVQLLTWRTTGTNSPRSVASS